MQQTLLNSESDDGGFGEFREFCPNRAVNSATCASSCPIRSACTATRTASSSKTDGDCQTHTMINVRMQRSTSHAKDLTSYYA